MNRDQLYDAMANVWRGTKGIPTLAVLCPRPHCTRHSASSERPCAECAETELSALVGGGLAKDYVATVRYFRALEDKILSNESIQ